MSMRYSTDASEIQEMRTGVGIRGKVGEVDS